MPLGMRAPLRELNLDGARAHRFSRVAWDDGFNLSYTRHLENLKPLRVLLCLEKLVLNRKSIVRLAALLSLTEHLQYLEIADTNV
jgi:hypothetical protein